ncbi:MAG TPA: NAD(P)/FAD-dependent oxidoreductase [Sporichthya sp.]|nr:NAD(P)/FAD-dependent oxidoreductase [Sporichthya sp.]
MSEGTDVVVVGARCAGSAAAIALARRGRSVIALDAAHFPSDTNSTHLFFPNHWAEVAALGALDRVMALDPPLHTRAGLGTARSQVVGPYTDYEGFAYGSCVKRYGLDLALVETARAAGAEVRERTKVTGLLRDATGRVSGVEWTARDGTTGTIGAKLVIGADGRRSTVGRMVGTAEHHVFGNGRMMAYAYYRDPRTELRDLAMQWRQEDELVTVFPCDGGQSLVLLMPPTTKAPTFRDDAIEAFEKTVASIEPLRERLVGCERETRVRVSFEHPSYFRHSTGPGWALAGDAGHFKDPVTAQGIRDALRFGRLLGEAVAPNLEDRAGLDAALRAWEIDRDAQCLPMYQWANGLGLPDHISPIENAAYAWASKSPERASEILDVFSRKRDADQVFTPARLLRWIGAALRDPATSRGEVARTLKRDVGREIARRKEAAQFQRRRAASGAEAARSTAVTDATKSAS